MPRTPDRSPGPLEEDEELRFTSEPGATPSQNGAMTYDPGIGVGAFQFRDGLGVFDPRSDGITETQHAVLDTFLHGLSESHEDVPAFNADGVITSITARAIGGSPLIRDVDSLTFDVDGLVTGFRMRQRDAAGVVVETLTGVVTVTGAVPQKSTVTKT